MKMWSILLAVSVIVPSLGIPLRAAELPPELPLWEAISPAYAFQRDDEDVCYYGEMIVLSFHTVFISATLRFSLLLRTWGCPAVQGMLA